MNDEPPDSGPVPHRSMWQRRRRSIMITGWIIVGVAALIGGYCFYAFKNV